MPTYRPLYNYISHGKATPNSAGYQPNGNSAAIRMANVGNSGSGQKDLSSQGDEDKERLYTGPRFGTTTEVQGDEETGHRQQGEILVTSEFTTTGMQSRAP